MTLPLNFLNCRAGFGAPVIINCGCRAERCSTRPYITDKFTSAGYCAATKCARRFCCQHSSVCSVQKGRSLPQLTVSMRLAPMPSEIR